MGRGRHDATRVALVGREREVADLTAFLAAARSRPTSLLLVGDAGLGKTALLSAAAAHARELGFRVLSATPAGVEPFGLLRRLLASCHLDLTAFPEHLRRVLEEILTPHRQIAPADESALLTALLIAVDRLSARCPVLVVVDDALRADSASLRLLTLLLRNASTERVALLLAARGGGLPMGIGPEIARYELGPLTDEAAAQLLDARPAPDGGRVRREILRRAAGNPLALITFSDPFARLPGEFPDRLAGLPAETRRLLLHAAIAGDAESIVTINQAAGGRADLREWQPAEEAGLVTVVDGRVRFRHPLVRAACSADAGRDGLPRAHRALATVTDDPHRRAWHLAAAAPGADESVAAALAGTADSAGRRGDHVDEARAWQAAAERSPDGTDAARRYARAVFAAYRTGDPGWTVELYEKAVPLTADPDILGAAACGAALALIHAGRTTRAFELTRQAVLRHPRDTQVAVTAVAVAATAALYSGVAAHREQLPGLLAQAAGDHVGELGEAMTPRAASPVARASVLAISDPAGRAGLAAEPPVAMTGLAEVARMLFTGTIAWLLDDSVRAAAELHAVWQVQQSAGAPGAVAARLPLLILAMIDSGKWAEADQVLDGAEELAAVGNVTLLRGILPALRAILRALRHEEQPAAVAAAGPFGNALADSLGERAAGLAALAAADYETAYRHFRRLFDDTGEPVHYFLGPRSLPQLALAAARSGHTGQARRILAECVGRAGDAPTSRMELLLAHAAALLDDTDQAEEQFQRAIGDPRRSWQWPLEFAEAQLNFGRWLRRRRRVLQARPHLLAALDTFQRLGAHGHAEQARKSLPAGGPPAAETPPPADALAALTAQKQLIARLAAAGMTNREIADRLVVSPRTVGSHLYDIYPVLGVSNRHQLRRLLAGPAPAEIRS